jgi:hypothetical protein
MKTRQKVMICMYVCMYKGGPKTGPSTMTFKTVMLTMDRIISNVHNDVLILTD